MSEIITCPSGLSGRIRGMRVREERVLADRRPAKSGGQADELFAAWWEETLDAEPYDVGEKLHLTSDELAFYDALEVNDSAVKLLRDDTLKTIVRELVETVRRNVTIDWTVKESVRAKLRVIVKRILRKYGYPPD